MKVELKADQPLTDDACKQATGKTITEWKQHLANKPELAGKRRETINYLHEAMNKDVWWPTTLWVEMQREQGVVLKDGKPDGYNICCTKTISAPIEKVFAAFTNGQVADWLGDSAKADASSNLSDARGNRGSATRVRENKDLRYKWQTAGSPDETDVDVMFTEKAGKTGIVLNHNRIQTRDEADGLRRAWGESFDRLKALMEGK